MQDLELIPRRWLEYEPPSNCHDFGISALAASVAAGVSSAASAVTAGAGAAALGAGTAGALAAVPLGVGTAAAATSAAAATGILGTGIGLSEIGSIASMGGSLMQAGAQSDAADAAAAAQRAQAAELRIKASDEAASGQRVAIGRERQTQVAQSRIRALAAASGGSATDPTVLTLEQQVAEQGGYNALSALYEGQARSRTDELAAEIELFKARRSEAAGPIAAAGTIFSGISSFANSRSRSRYFAGLTG